MEEWKAKQQVAQHLAMLNLSLKTMLYRQWFPGKENVVADSLSHDVYFMSPLTHTAFLKLVIPEQLPKNFQIQPLPTRICSFITSLLQHVSVQQQRLKAQRPSKLAHGQRGALSSIALALRTHHTLKDVIDSNKISCFQRLNKLSGLGPSLQDIVEHWWKGQSVPQSHMWHRPSGQVTAQTPDWTRMEKCVSC